MQLSKPFAGTLLFIATLFLASGHSLAASSAGKVQRAKGFVMAASPEQGRIRPLRAGDGIAAGETISTGPNSTVQLDFNDGSHVALKPNSRFQIEAFVVRKEKPEEERSFFSLIKGGLRAVTGLIGKRKPANYRMKTAVATIGIRGTDYELRLTDQGLYAGVTPGTDSRIVIRNQAGIRELVAGQYAWVKGPDQPIIPLAVRPPQLGEKPQICK
ncbi:MAG: hypothetical protein D6786_02935 [Gammaproteobacteria bacterium]|nr:MAG: hypothetical protein D6786_02935 [Gammaproteobacteria bacterium]